MSDRSSKRVFLEITIDGQKEGRIICELFDKLAPRTAENFRALCTGEYGKVGDVKLTYKGAIFHRVVKNFMIQGGDITASDGTGGMSIYGRTFDDEEFMESHSEPYLLSMANRGPNTNSSQFFITTAIARHLDTKHVVFGRVVKGKELVDKIEQIRVNDASKPYQDVMITNCGELFKKSRAEEAQVIDENKDEFLEEEQASAVPDVSTVKAEDLPPEPKTRNWLLRRSRSRSRSKSRDDKEESSSRKRRDSREERHSRKRDRDDYFDRNREDRLSKRSRKTSRSPDRRRSPERSIKDRITRTQNGGSGGTRVKGRGTPRFQRDRTPPHWKREEQKKTSLDDYYSGVKKQEEEKRMADAKEKKDQEDQKLKRREEMERELELMSKKQEKKDDGSDEYDEDDEDRVDLEGSDSD